MKELMKNGSGIADPTAYKAMMAWDIETGDILKNVEGRPFVIVKSFPDARQPYAVAFYLIDHPTDSPECIEVKADHLMYGECTRLVCLSKLTKNIDKYTFVRSLTPEEMQRILKHIVFGLHLPYKVPESPVAEPQKDRPGAVWISKALEILGITKQALSEASGVSSSAISAYTGGKYDPKEDTLEKVLNGLFSLVRGGGRENAH